MGKSRDKYIEGLFKSIENDTTRNEYQYRLNDLLEHPSVIKLKEKDSYLLELILIDKRNKNQLEICNEDVVTLLTKYIDQFPESYLSKRLNTISKNPDAYIFSKKMQQTALSIALTALQVNLNKNTIKYLTYFIKESAKLSQPEPAEPSQSPKDSDSKNAKQNALAFFLITLLRIISLFIFPTVTPTSYKNIIKKLDINHERLQKNRIYRKTGLNEVTENPSSESKIEPIKLDQQKANQNISTRAATPASRNRGLSKSS